MQKLSSYIVLIISALLISCRTTRITDNKSDLLGLTLEEKVGQLFIIRPDSIDPKLTPEDIERNYLTGVTSVTEDMASEYEYFPAGGFILFQKNIKSPEQVRNFNNQLHSLGKVKPLICIDEEGGVVARLANTKGFNLPKYENMGKLSESEDLKKIFDAGLSIGAYLTDYGFNIDFAPVADVNTNPKNPIIGTRAFSSNPVEAGNRCMIFWEGLNASGIEGCLKHFPGHGDTKTDTHKEYAETTKTWEELIDCEIIPFKNGIEKDVELIMVAHIAAPKVDSSSLPSTLSYTMLTEKLRNELGYKGIIITDAMEMKAITSAYSSGDAAIMALLAGADIVLMPYDYKAAYTAVLQAVRQGQIPEKRIDESVCRILKLKNKL